MITSTSASLTLEGAEFVGNSAPGATGDGGAIRINNGGSVTVTGSLLVQGNSAGQDGGGISASTGATLEVQGRAIIVSNSAGRDGGGISGPGAGRAINL